MKKKWLIAFVIVVGFLIVAFLWMRSIPEPKWVGLNPEKNSENYRAYCAKKIERVRVVHLIPGELNKPVTLGKLDPQFVQHAQRTLDQFWHGEIVVVLTNNGGALFPVSDREMTVGFLQGLEGEWHAFALLYDESKLMWHLQSTASRDDSLIHNTMKNWNRPEDVKDTYYNKTGNISSVLYDKETGEFHRDGDGDGKGPSKPRLFVRSLQDVVAGRCDRLMSEAVYGPAAWKRPAPLVGEF
jgi:hypothetical protein